MAGYDRDNRPFRATVSNVWPGNGGLKARERFVSDVRTFYPWDPKPDIHVAGAIATFEAKDNYARALKKIRTKAVKHMRKRGDKLDHVQMTQMMVSLLRSATTHPKFGHVIGRDCLSVAAFPRGPGMLGAVSINVAPSAVAPKDTPFTSHYHPVQASSVLYGPLLADPYLTVLSMEVDLDPQIPDAPVES